MCQLAEIAQFGPLKQLRSPTSVSRIVIRDREYTTTTTTGNIAVVVRIDAAIAAVFVTIFCCRRHRIHALYQLEPCNVRAAATRVIVIVTAATQCLWCCGHGSAIVSVHLVNVEQRQAAADLWTKPIDSYSVYVHHRHLLLLSPWR